MDSYRASVAVIEPGEAGKSYLGSAGQIYLLNKAEALMDLKVKYKWENILPSLLGSACSLGLDQPAQH